MNGGNASNSEDAVPTGADGSAESTAAWSNRTIGERPGDLIGPYKLLSILGEGGFGTVYLAERRDPHIQRVALKIIKPGMDSKAVIARFEQERQALAVMDHPNVAKVYDAGATPLGRPYFVMEAVQGEAITTYCDRLNLTIKQRLELFIPVCEAVQHAHHKGIIHRDIKPSNIMVMIKDGNAIPKVIDFGVAKAVAKALTDKTIFTEEGAIWGTYEYMSPEQAEMGRLDVDARTDVYSLGVLLYELLTGALPFDSAYLRSMVRDEVRRIIREVEPPTPSTVLGSGRFDTIAIAKMRGMSSRELRHSLRGEIAWIPLKAMRKDRVRRYATPKELADDLRNYLAGRPLHAGPESDWYRLRKLLRRYRTRVGAAAAMLLILLAGVVIISWLAARFGKKYADMHEGIFSLQEYLRKPMGVVAPNSYLVELLSQEEYRDSARRTLAFVPVKKLTSNDLMMPLVILDNQGKIDWGLPTTITIPSWVSRDASHTDTKSFEIRGAMLQDVLPDHIGRELVVCLSSEYSVSVLRIYALDHLEKPIKEMWNVGTMLSPAWNAAQHQIMVVCDSSRLAYYVPELVKYDSMGCVGQQRDAHICVAIHPNNVRGVLFPTGTNQAPAPAVAEWGLAREPVEVGTPGSAWAASNVWAVEVRHPDDPPNLLLRFDARARSDLHPTLSVRIRVGPGGRSTDVLDEEFDDGNQQLTRPDHHLVPVDLNALAKARPIVEPLMKMSGSYAKIEKQLRADRSLDHDTLQSALSMARAMSENWRWLHVWAEAKANEMDASPEALADALQAAKSAVEIHRTRCLSPESCWAGWYPQKGLAIVQIRTGDYKGSLATLKQCESVLQAAGNEVSFKSAGAIDLALMAKAHYQLVDVDLAKSELDRARSIVAENQGDGLTAEAQEIIDDVQNLLSAGISK